MYKGVRWSVGTRGKLNDLVFIRCTPSINIMVVETLHATSLLLSCKVKITKNHSSDKKNPKIPPNFARPHP